MAINSRALLAKGPPVQPFWLNFLRIAILVLSLGVFIAACYNVSRLDSTLGGSGPGGLAIFTCIWTWICVGSDLALAAWARHLYLRVAFLALYATNVIFWLATWAYAADAASDVFRFCGGATVCGQFGGSLAAIAAIGAFIWLALVVLFGIWLWSCLKEPEGVTAANAELHNVKPQESSYPQESYSSSHIP